MNIIKAEYHGIKLLGGYQFWSNPSMFDTDSAIGVVLMRPTLIDLIRLKSKYGIDRLYAENDDLMASSTMTKSQHDRNFQQLIAIASHDD